MLHQHAAKRLTQKNNEKQQSEEINFPGQKVSAAMHALWLNITLKSKVKYRTDCPFPFEFTDTVIVNTHTHTHKPTATAMQR